MRGLGGWDPGVQAYPTPLFDLGRSAFGPPPPNGNKRNYRERLKKGDRAFRAHIPFSFRASLPDPPPPPNKGLPPPPGVIVGLPLDVHAFRGSKDSSKP